MVQHVFLRHPPGRTGPWARSDARACGNYYVEAKGSDRTGEERDPARKPQRRQQAKQRPQRKRGQRDETRPKRSDNQCRRG